MGPLSRSPGVGVDLVAAPVAQLARRILDGAAPAAALVLVEGDAAQVQRRRRRRARRELDAHDDLRVVLDAAVGVEVDAIGEADGEARRGAACVAKKPKPKRGMRKKVMRGRDEDADRHDRRGAEEAPADDAARVEDALDLDALGAVVGVLDEVVLLHLATQVEERQRPGGEHDVGEEAAGVGEIGVERGAGDEHEEADDVGLQVVARRLAVPQLVDEQEAEEADARAEELAADGLEQRPGEDGERERVPRRRPGARAQERHARRLEEERERSRGRA